MTNEELVEGTGVVEADGEGQKQEQLAGHGGGGRIEGREAEG